MHFNREYNRNLFLGVMALLSKLLLLSFLSQNRKVPYQSLEDDCDRRVMGHATKVKASGELFFPFNKQTKHSSKILQYCGTS